jgi:hypothetical protein
MHKKPAFLLANATSFALDESHQSYDKKEQINTILDHDQRRRAFVATDDFAPTESKTMKAPGDDDPDPEDEGCY